MCCLLVVLVKLSVLAKRLARETCLCPDSFVFPWAVESSPLQFFGAGVTNLNEPPRALATTTIMWIRS